MVLVNRKGIGEGLLGSKGAREVKKPKKGGEAMLQAVIQFWKVTPEGTPKKVSYAIPAHPCYWPQNPPSVLIEVKGEVPDWLIEEAASWGWGFNPHTKTFYRLD